MGGQTNGQFPYLASSRYLRPEKTPPDSEVFHSLSFPHYPVIITTERAASLSFNLAPSFCHNCDVSTVDANQCPTFHKNSQA